ncbi:16S rRNA methyltransferase [Alginatibacterium sediminis]|uniref:Ribosomal RNA small subunit methyltransferase J n=1 Tax=Alginatibacterium sediminis TaxID=2164068 RepID=A0A420ENC9_9ALTE|nr:class I SAM-dependent methyltransferase [Alginatibacterium sediminis]RKF22163.1 16S rRNA methyltransferase [Alginatibacterium sediminis]
MTTTALYCSTTSQLGLAADICSRYNLELNPSSQDTSQFFLSLDQDGLGLHWREEPKIKPLRVDFTQGKTAHRRKFGGSEAIARAVAYSKACPPSVIDATAGLGRDAFVLASLGCKVTLLERSPIVAALLEDGLRRAAYDPDIGAWVGERMHLIHTKHLSELKNYKADVVYLDPMYPEKKKKAQIKKEMRIFQLLVGKDLDADMLLPFALQSAAKRVVVKRPDYAPFLNQHKTSTFVPTKSHRFDIYSTISADKT